MIKKTALFFLVLGILLGPAWSAALAQTYSLSLPSEVVNAYYNQDGTLSLDYVFTFANDASASPIDFVDVGLPNDSYDMSTVTADVNGNPVTNISKADPNNLQGGSNGVTLGLGSQQIAPGATGKVHLFVGKISRVVNPYTYNNVKDYASVNIVPTWFGSSFVHGQTNLTVSLHLPPGIQTNEPIYFTPSSNWPGSADPTTALDSQGRVLYTWSSPDANGSTEYTFGAGFPAKYIPAAAIVQPPLINIQPQTLICCAFLLLFLFIIGFSIYQGIWGARKRKLAYLPPKISIEGHGIKRGLTAVEAAVLEEQPLDKVMTMILFGAIKKSAATVTTRDPLELQVTTPLPEGLTPYETDFLTAFQKPNGPDRRRGLQDMMVNLVKGISEKMKGFSRKETIAYYESITKQAWDQVEAANTPDVKSQKYEEVMDWTMLDHDYSGRTRTTFGSGPIFVPIWWGRYDPVFRSQGGGFTPTAAPSLGGGGHTSMPSLPGADFAASMVNGVQTFSAGVLGSLTGFTSGVTNVTNPPPPPSASSGSGWHGGGGGGGHCACACACAGCACACAGGGR
ncbi:MAG TPA: hypothetical protein VGJ97_00670 [Anaerolineaceae bacterium]|jgi:hypothetical protein